MRAGRLNSLFPTAEDNELTCQMFRQPADMYIYIDIDINKDVDIYIYMETERESSVFNT